VRVSATRSSARPDADDHRRCQAVRDLARAAAGVGAQVASGLAKQQFEPGDRATGSTNAFFAAGLLANPLFFNLCAAFSKVLL
jgi:hypothetical protein